MTSELGAFDLDGLLRLVVRFLAALTLALPIGWEREVSARSAGLRTFPLVALAACGYVLVAVQVIGPAAEAQARVLQGLMTGIGFVGGGAILKEPKVVRGTATAASIWATGALGAAAGYGRLDTALLLSALTLVTLRVLSAVERRLARTHGTVEPDES